jgi:RNA polymerase sigma-70 factor (ECF subfamily)
MRHALAWPGRPRVVQAAIHRAWCARPSLAEPPPWPAVLALYDALLQLRDDPVVRLNRLVALAECIGPRAALSELEELRTDRLSAFLPFQALRADLLRRCGYDQAARAAYQAALALEPSPAEALWLQRQLTALKD